MVFLVVSSLDFIVSLILGPLCDLPDFSFTVKVQSHRDPKRSELKYE